MLYWCGQAADRGHASLRQLSVAKSSQLVGSSRTCTLYTGVFVCVRESERECEGAVYSCVR